MNRPVQNAQTELKGSFYESEEALISMAGILNAFGEGAIYFGINKNGTQNPLFPAHNLRQSVLDFSRAIKERLRPIPKVSIETVSFPSFKGVRVLFSGHEFPYSVDGIVYFRQGGHDRVIATDELWGILHKRGDHSPFFAAASDEIFNSLDEKAIISFLRHGRLNERHHELYVDAPTSLKLLGLLNDDSSVSMDAYWLFSKDKPLILKIEMSASADPSSFQGNILECLQEALPLLAARFALGRPKKERDVASLIIAYPFLFEALVNAFAHLDYSLSKEVVIAFESQYVSIKNVCAKDDAKNELTPYLKGIRASNYHNPRLNLAFYMGGYSSFGQGLSLLAANCQDKRIRYEIIQDDGSFEIRFFRLSRVDDSLIEKPNDVISTKTEMSDDKKPSLSSFEEKLLSILKEKPEMTIPELSRKLGKSTATTHRAIASLMQIGVLSRLGSRKKGQWEVHS